MMKQLFVIICLIASLTVMAAPHVNKADLAQANKGQMVMKANTLANHLNGVASKNFMEAAKKNVQMNHATNLVNKRAPRRLTNEEIISGDYVCFLYAYDIMGEGPVQADPFFAGSGAYWYPMIDEDGTIYFAGFYWDENGSTYYLPLEIDYSTGDVALPWALLLKHDSVIGTARNRTDTVWYEILVSQDYWENEEPNDCMGTLYEDGSIIFDDNYVYYAYKEERVYRNRVLQSVDTFQNATMYVGTEILAANGVLTYNKEQDGSADSSPVYMFQEGNDLYVGNMWNYGVPTCKMTLTKEGKAIYECAEFDPTDSTTYLSNPIWDVKDSWISGGLGMFYGVGSYELDENGYIVDYTWGFEGEATLDQITWAYTMPCNGYHFLYGYKNNVLRYTNGSNFILYGLLFEVDGIKYFCGGDDETVTVFRVVNHYGNVIVPETVEYNGIIYTVTGIAGGAFDGCELDWLVLPVSLVSIDSYAFMGCSIGSLFITGNGSWQGGAINAAVETLYIGSGVTGIPGLQINANEIYSYASTPPLCDESTFTDYGATLHMPATSFAAYFVAPYWCNFGNIMGDAVEPTGVTLNEDSADLLVYDQLNLTATVTPANATPHTVTWSTTNSGVATVNDGVVTAVGEGECDIIASCLDIRAVCHITSSVIEVTSIILNQEDAILEVNEQISLTAAVAPDNATYGTVMWSTTNSAVATIDTNGMVTAVGVGECDIIAACGGKQAICHVVVVTQKIYITLDKHTADVLPNHMITLIPSVTPISTELKVTSSDPTMAAARIVNGVIQVVGITEGTVTITVGSQDGHAFADTCQVTVYTELGDVNCDGFVNINDVTIMIDYLLGYESTNFKFENADVKHDDCVNIVDVTTLIDILLSGEQLNKGVVEKEKGLPLFNPDTMLRDK